ncbi:MAG: response regulator transcription factor [Clostridia bacterium]
MRILLCEDEKNLNKLIKQKLESEGYAVDSCFNGSEGLDYIDSMTYDLILLDIMMPKMNGLEFLKIIREKGIDYPVLFLTAKDSSEDIVLGLDSGANDYIVKPFVFSELLARIRVIIRTKPQHKGNILKFKDLELDMSQKIVKRSDNIIKLTLKEYAILEYMMLNQNVVLTKEQIEDSIWNFDYEGEGGLVKVYISYLRKKIDDGFDEKLIHTIRGVGYVLKGG